MPKRTKPEELIQFGSLFWRRKTKHKIEFKELFDIARKCDVEIVEFTFYDGEVAPGNYYDQHYVRFSIKGTSRSLEKFWNGICENKFLDFFQI